MNGLTRSRVATYLAAVFVAGAAAGVAGGYQYGRKSVFRRGSPPPRDMAAHMVERYTKELVLTPEQVQKVEPMIQEASQKVRALHKESFKQTDAIMKGCNARIVDLLDPAQKERFRLMEERRNQWMRDRGGDGQRGRPGGAPPEGGRPPGPGPEPGTGGSGSGLPGSPPKPPTDVPKAGR